MRCCPIAQSAGVVPGMTLSEGRAICPEAQAEKFDPFKSRQAMGLLAKWALRFSPVVAVDPTPAGRHPDDLPDGLLLDITGTAHLFGGEALFMTEIAQRLKRLGFGARMAIGPTIGAAWALARFGRHPAAKVDEGQVPEALAPLPVAALRLTQHVAAGLQEVGVEKVQELLRLPRGSVLVRFGEEVLLRMDQAFGRANELLEPLRLCEPITVRRFFDGQTSQLEAVMLAAKELLTELCAKLLEKESGVRGMKLEWARINSPAISREFVLSRPNRDVKHLYGLMHPKMETMHMGYGVEGITLSAYWSERIPHTQTGAWEQTEWENEHDEAYNGFLDTLVNRWGNGRVLVAHPAASHVPEAARRFVPVGGAAEADRPAEMVCIDRPALLFERPEQAEGMALSPDRPPAWIRWRGREYVLEAGTGPERIVTEWWGVLANGRGNKPGGGMSTRDYFKVQTGGATWLWVFRELESGSWFVHGIWA